MPIEQTITCSVPQGTLHPKVDAKDTPLSFSLLASIHLQPPTVIPLIVSKNLHVRPSSLSYEGCSHSNGFTDDISRNSEMISSGNIKHTDVTLKLPITGKEERSSTENTNCLHAAENELMKHSGDFLKENSNISPQQAPSSVFDVRVESPLKASPLELSNFSETAFEESTISRLKKAVIAPSPKVSGTESRSEESKLKFTVGEEEPEEFLRSVPSGGGKKESYQTESKGYLSPAEKPKCVQLKFADILPISGGFEGGKWVVSPRTRWYADMTFDDCPHQTHYPVQHLESEDKAENLHGSSYAEIESLRNWKDRLSNAGDSRRSRSPPYESRHSEESLVPPQRIVWATNSDGISFSSIASARKTFL